MFTHSCPMFKRFFKSFPPPQYLQMPAIGVDISDEAVRFIEFTEKRHGLDLKRHGEKKLPEGAIMSGYINNHDLVSAALNDLKKEHDFHFIVPSLPEEKVYLFKTDVDSVDPKEIAESIEFKMEENVPVAPQDALFDYDIITKDETLNKSSVSVSVVPTKVVETYHKVCTDAGLTPVSFEIEGRALARTLIPKSDQESYLIVNFTENKTGLTIVSNNIVRFTSTVTTGGRAVTAAMQKALSVTPAEAYKLKFENGITKTKGNEKAVDAALSVLSEIKDEINKVLVYWQTHSDKSQRIDRIILCGKNSMIKGFDAYLSVAVKTKAEVANVWTNLFSFDTTIPKIEVMESLDYAVAIGLTLGEHQKYV